MDRLEQDLRRVLRDPWRSPASPPDIVARVHSGMARRRSRRRTVTASGAALAVVLVAGVSAVLTRDGQPTSADVVRWLDAPVTPYTPASPVTQAARPTAPACQGVDLRLAGVTGEGAAGHTGTFIKVENAGPSRCTLSGSPALDGLDSAGVRARIPVEGGTSFDPPDARERPATIDSVDWAVLTIETSHSCDASATIYRRVQIRLSDGTSFEVAKELSSTCPIRVGRWYRAIQPASEPPEPWTTLQARLDGVPATVRAGEAFDYIVELANTGPADVTLEPCPAYAQVLRDTSADYRLDCASVSIIPAGGSVRFAMRLPVGADLPAGPMKMSWNLHGSRVGAGTWVTVVAQ